MNMQTNDLLFRWLDKFAIDAASVAALPRKPHLMVHLMEATGMTAHGVSQHLRLAGWHCERRVGTNDFGTKKILVWWSPAGQRAPRIPKNHYEWLHACT